MATYIWLTKVLKTSVNSSTSKYIYRGGRVQALILTDHNCIKLSCPDWQGDQYTGFSFPQTKAIWQADLKECLYQRWQSEYALSDLVQQNG